MKNLVNSTMEEAKTFSVMDFGIFKIVMITFGILSGVYFYKFFKKARPAVWATFGGSAIYMIYRMFCKGKCCSEYED